MDGFALARRGKSWVCLAVLMKPTTVRARTGIPLRFLVPASCAMAVLLVALVGISRREEAAKPMTTTATSPDSSTVAKLAPLLRSSPASPPPPLSGDRHARRLQEIEQLCGRLCSYRDALETHDAAVKRRPNARWSRDFVDPDQYAWFNEMVRKDVPVDCKVLYSETAVALFDTPASDQSEWLPPDSMNAAYTMGGRIRIGIRKKETNALYLGADALQAEWSREKIEETKKAAARDEFKGNYGLIEAILLKNALLTLPTKGKRLLVVGSEIPWVEAMLLNGRAASVTTLEYGAIRSSHPQVTTYTPSVFAKEFLAGKLEPFDGIVSYSSLEHSGLHRYGDEFNPHGDVISVARLACVLRPGGFFLLAVPSDDESESIVWNAHRTYSHMRLSYLLTNWRLAMHRRGDAYGNDIYVAYVR